MSTNTLTAERERWLYRLTDEVFRPWFEEVGAKVPERLRIGVGWSSKGSRSNVIGETWNKAASADGTFEVIIAASQSDSLRVADILLHELCHAALPLGAGHGKPFKDLATSLGLAGQMTATVASPELREALAFAIAKLGPYPHRSVGEVYRTAPGGGDVPLGPGLVPSSGPKQGTRMLKCECETEDCEAKGYTVRLTAKWIEAAGTPLCPACEHPLTQERK